MARLVALKDWRYAAELADKIGCVYDQQGNFTDAINSFQQELSFAQNCRSRSFEWQALNRIAGVYSDMGRSADADAMYAAAQSRFASTTNPSSAEMAQWRMSLAEARRKGDRERETTVLDRIGYTYERLNRPEDALAAYRQVQARYAAAGNKKGEAIEFDSMGRVCCNGHRFREALEAYAHALKLNHAIGDGQGEGLTRTIIGQIHLDTGRTSLALRDFRQSLAPLRASGNTYFVASSLLTIAAIDGKMGDSRGALAAYREAENIYGAGGEREYEAGAYTEQAIYEQKLGRREAAEASFSKSIAITEDIRSGLGSNVSSRETYLASKRGTYSQYLDCLLTTPASSNTPKKIASTANAFELAEHTKARSLLDLLDNGQINLTTALTGDERAELNRLRQRTDTLNVAMVKEGVDNEIGARARFAKIQEEQRENEGELRRLTDALYAKHPGLAERTSAKIATVAELSKVVDPSTALLEYVQVSSNRVAVFVVERADSTSSNPCRVTASYLKIPASLASDCAAFQTACADPRRDYKPLAARIYRALVAPVSAAIAGKKRVIVCPDGPLWNVPFQALTCGGGKNGDVEFLSDRCEIDYAYSATGALAAAHERARQSVPAMDNRRETSMLVVANPSFGDAKRFGDLDGLPGQRPLDTPSRPLDTPSRPLDVPSRPIVAPSRLMEVPSRPMDLPSRTMAETLSRGGRIAALPGTQREADALQRLYPDAKVLTGDNAQESVVKKDASKFAYLHFATHGFVNNTNPMLSSLVLAQPDAATKAAGDDGFLTARELFDMHLNAEMVTLSACNTGRGDISTGEGVIGLTWALFAAGCPTQVVSQWSVDDACTATLMAKFYAEIKAGKPKGVALHDAARSIAHDGVAAHRHPYYWAPFVLFGDWN